MLRLALKSRKPPPPKTFKKYQNIFVIERKYFDKWHLNSYFRPLCNVLVKEANDLIKKHAVSLFLNHEKVDQWRPILHSKYFDDFVKKYQFKMETLANAWEWIKPGNFCTSLDLKDGFLHIPIHKTSKKFLRFKWLNQFLEWQVLVFGLTCSPRVITKILKLVVDFWDLLGVS